MRAFMVALSVLASAGCALAIAGCAALSTPTTTTTAPSTVARADTTHEVPTPPPPLEQPAGPSSASAVIAVRAFAAAYINWTARSVKDDLLRLAALSVGQARSAMTLAAAQTAADYELHRGGIANSGAIESVAPLPGRAGQYVVVTRESTTATRSNAYAGLRAAWHVTIATVRRLPSGGWVVSGWQPQS
jgi:hypothetical protein